MSGIASTQPPEQLKAAWPIDDPETLVEHFTELTATGVLIRL